MSEEQNDSPAFRLRPRRAAPKSYYTVRLEYSANPAAFIRERPRTKRKVFAQKSAANLTKTSRYHDPRTKPELVTKEEQELEEKRMQLSRAISESITVNTAMSPFMQRVHFDELRSDTTYEHNYVYLKIDEVNQSRTGRSLQCLCRSIDDHPRSEHQFVQVRLYNRYADSAVVKAGKFISIAKFRTGPIMSKRTSESDDARSTSPPPTQETAIIKQQTVASRSNSPAASSSQVADTQDCVSVKCEELATKDTILLPFYILVRYDEHLERPAVDPNERAALASASCCLAGVNATRKKPLMPFVSIVDMIEEPASTSQLMVDACSS